MFFIPVALVVAWGLYGVWSLPRWTDPRYLRNPTKAPWSAWTFFSDKKWTEEGLQLRRAYVRHWLIGIVIGLGAFFIVTSIELLGRSRP
jgi:hypothetical protein